MIKEVREFYRIPQSLMADYLLVTRSHLSMAEIGQRDLTLENTKTLLSYYMVMMGKETAKDEKLDKEQAAQLLKRQKLVKKQYDNCKFKLESVHRKLAKIKAAQEHCLEVIGKLKALKAALKRPHDEGIIVIIEIQIHALQERTGLDVQFALEFQIAGLEAQMNFLKQQGV